MDIRIVMVGISAGLAAVFAILLWFAFSGPVGKFSYVSPDGKSMMTYTCKLRGAAEASEANAKIAHSYYSAAASELARAHATGLLGGISKYTQASGASDKLDALRGVDTLRTTVAADRKSLNKELYRLYGCRYLQE